MVFAAGLLLHQLGLKGMMGLFRSLSVLQPGCLLRFVGCACERLGPAIVVSRCLNAIYKMS